jgi:hypothetical protein
VLRVVGRGDNRRKQLLRGVVVVGVRCGAIVAPSNPTSVSLPTTRGG